MPFNLEIIITGICAFVENEDKSGQPRVCVVLPNTAASRNALDDEPLCPHHSYIEQGYGFGVIRTPLRRQRIKFSAEGGDNKPIELPLETAKEKVPGLIDISKSPIFKHGNPPKTNPAVAYINKVPDELVMAQILLEKSENGKFKFTTTGYWDFDPKGGGFLAAHEVKVTLKDLESARAFLETFDKSRLTSVDLTPPAGVPVVRFRIINTCERDYLEGRSYRDRDFKWYYELLEIARKKSVKDELESDDLPIPRFIKPPYIGGNNCFPARLEPVKFE